MTESGSLALLLAERVAEGPDHPLLFVEEEGPWRVGQLAAAAATLAGALTARGVGRGQRVVVRLGNDERFLVALVATWLRQSAAIAMHPATPVDDVRRVVADFGAAAIVADPDDRVRDGIDVPVVDVGRLDLAAPSVAQLDVPDDGADDDEAIILLTSGSTGSPKGVVLSHANGWSNLRATASGFRKGGRSGTGPPPLGRVDRPPNLVANPFSHTGGLVRLLLALHVGRRLVVLRKFDPLKALAAVHRHGIDNLTINPTMIRMLLDAVPSGDGLGPVRYVSSGTAPLPPSLRDEFEARFGIPVLQVYGQTETFGAVAMESPGDVLAGRRRPDSVGRPLPDVDIRIADGEILVRSKSATHGYAAAGGASSPVTSPVDGDGWLHTGDLGRLDADGYLYVTGRLKNVIICGGFNIVPEELEARLEEDPGVREAAVVALADHKLGEIPVALVVGRGDAAEIMERTKEQLVAYKRPRRLFVVDALPRLASGKVDKPAATRLAEKLSADS